MSSTPREHPLEAPVIPDFLRPLRSVVLAVLRPDGSLCDANTGFHALLPGAGDAPTPERVRAVFLNPGFEELVARARDRAGEVTYAGRMTLGAVDGDAETWCGHVSCRGDHLLVVCERDVEQDRSVQKQLLRLTEDYAEQERQLARAHRQLADYAEEVERLSLTDALTQLPNRRQFDTILRHALDAGARGRTPLSLLLLDLDRFKAINDTHGHQQGDHVLRVVASVLADNVRGADFVARWGGEEFAVLAADTDAAGALELAERLRRAVQDLEPGDGLPAVTISAGVTERDAHEDAATLFRRADAALYRAKADGRNRVVLADADT